MSDVLFEVLDGVALITLNRPEVRNAVSLQVAQELAAIVDAIDDTPSIRCAVITGAGGSFCAGMDLKGFARGERPTTPGRGFAGITERPPRKPLIAAVEGWALAGGFELALAADVIVAASDARFGLPEPTRGLTAAAGGLIRLPRSIPYHRAMLLALTGDWIDGREAFELGLVSSLAAPGRSVDVAREIASRIARNAPLATQTTKRVLADSVSYTDPEQFAMCRAASAAVFASADAKEGARAFVEKREPRWTGA